MNNTSREKIKKTSNNPLKVVNKNDIINRNKRGRTPEYIKFNRMNITNNSRKKFRNNGEYNIKVANKKKFRTKSDLINNNHNSRLHYQTQSTSKKLLLKDNDIQNNELIQTTKKKNCKKSVDDVHTPTFTKNKYLYVFYNNNTTQNIYTQKINFNKIKENEENNKSKLKHNNYTHVNIINKENKQKEKEKNIPSCRTSYKKKIETKPIKDRNEKIIMSSYKNKINLYKTQMNDINNNKYKNNYNKEKKTRKKFMDKSKSTKKKCVTTRNNNDYVKKNHTLTPLTQKLNYEENINTEKKPSIKNNEENITNNIDDLKLTQKEKPYQINTSQKDFFINNKLDDDIDTNKNTNTNLQFYNQMANSLTPKIKTTEQKQQNNNNNYNNSIVERIIFPKNISKLLTSPNKIFKGKKIEKIGIISIPGEINLGEKKTNQDNFFNYDLCNDYKFIGVCDGHGEDGHHISEYIKNTLPDELNHLLKKLIDEEKENLGIEEQIIKDDIELRKKIEKFNKIKEIMTDSFKNTNIYALEECSKYNIEYSGSTCITIFLHKKKANKLFISNIGDSRSIIIKKQNNEYLFYQLSRDHKPSEKDEAKRIIENGGEIMQIEDENGNFTGPLRIWQKGENGPGLAMTRSFCDVAASMLGVICEPEVFEYKLKEEDKIIIVASDGLFEHVSNEEVCKIVGDFVDSEDCKENIENKIVENLYNFANERWKNKENGIDDITIICVMLENS